MARLFPVRPAERPAVQTPEGHSPAPSGLHGRLRAATATLHLNVERHLDLVDPALTRARYQSVLANLYGYYEPLEQRLFERPSAGPTPPCGDGFSPKRRAPALERDLLSLGVSPAAIAALPRCSRLPALNGPPDLVGCLYVIEGAALGGQLITRAIERHLGLSPAGGGSFFFGEGPGTGVRWRRFLSWIEEQTLTGTFAEIAVARACDTFRTLGAWLERGIPDP